jgi:hypothetical protein
MGSAVFDLGAAAKCSNGARVSSHRPSFLSAARVAGEGIGKITADACYPRHRHQEFLRFLTKVAAAHHGTELHIVLDNYGTHKHPEVRKWLAKPANKRITMVPSSFAFTASALAWLPTATTHKGSRGDEAAW